MNLFPSNIQGLPTWFTILPAARVHRTPGALRDLVAMNPATFVEDLAGLSPGRGCASTTTPSLPPAPASYTTFYSIPVEFLLRESNPPKALRDYVANMAYVGVVAQVLGIDLAEVRGALRRTFTARPRRSRATWPWSRSCRRMACQNLVKQDPLRRAAGRRAPGQDHDRRGTPPPRALRGRRCGRLVPDYPGLQPGRV